MFGTILEMKAQYRMWIVVFCLGLLSCNSKQKADEAWVDSVLQAIDSIPDEQLDFSVDEVPLSDAVDGNFNDFIYAFLHSRQLQSERVGWPLKVTDSGGEIVRTLRNRGELRKVVFPSSMDYFLFLLDDAKQLEEDAGSMSEEAFVHLVDFNDMRVNRCTYQRKNGIWMLGNVCEQSFSESHFGNFLSFYSQFSADSVYQIEHVAQPLNISMPDEENDMETIEGTIDADQFPLFSPELPSGVVMVVDYGQLEENANRVVMVKCGMSNGMMDIMTFEHEEGEWKLTGLEE